MSNLSRIENLAITGADGFVDRSIVEYIATLGTVCLPIKLTLVNRGRTNYSVAPIVENKGPSRGARKPRPDSSERRRRPR
jgi:hypothetical protein